ncbi:MAG TPA: PA2779 family protein [Acidiferrobacterales bacterium]|nr:PA2779 family protein [Acidiferrobacterales bacterium]
MLRSLIKPTGHFLILSFFSFSLYVPFAQANLVGTETVLHTERIKQAGENSRERILTRFNRSEIQAYLRAQGVNPNEAKARINSLTDAEIQTIAGKMDQLPAGGGLGDVLFVGLVVFLVLLATDILGYTDVFPFVKKKSRR